MRFYVYVNTRKYLFDWGVLLCYAPVFDPSVVNVYIFSLTTGRNELRVLSS